MQISQTRTGNAWLTELAAWVVLVALAGCGDDAPPTDAKTTAGKRTKTTSEPRDSNPISREPAANAKPESNDPPATEVIPADANGIDGVVVDGDVYYSVLATDEWIPVGNSNLPLIDVPAALAGRMFSKQPRYSATLRFEVTKPASVFVAFVLSGWGGGGGGGDWQNEIVTHAELVSQDWKEFATMKAGHVTWAVYSRDCKAGETFSLRNHKYEAPFLISAVQDTTVAAITPPADDSPAETVDGAAPEKAEPEPMTLDAGQQERMKLAKTLSQAGVFLALRHEGEEETEVYAPDQVPERAFEIRELLFTDQYIPPSDPENRKLIFDSEVAETVRRLKFENAEMTDADVEGIADFHNLKFLWIRSPYITNKTLSLASNWPDLEYVKFEFSGVTADGLAHIAHCTKMQRLDFNDVMTDQAMVHLKDMKEIILLNFVTYPEMNSRLSGRGFMFLKDFTKMRELRLVGQPITNAGLKHLPPLPDLQLIALYDTQVSNAGIEHLKTLPVLEHLFVNRNRMDAGAIEKISELSHLYQLEAVGLADDDNLRHVPNLKQLAELDFDYGTIAGPGLKHLGECNKLWYLSLNGNPIDDAGLKNLPATLTLRNLKLEETRITNASVEHLKQFKTLRRLSLSGTGIDETGLAELKTALPSTEIFAE